MPSRTYRVNELFWSLQGEGARAGMPTVFVRFSGCNLTCHRETHGFDCDTEFVSGQDMHSDCIASEILKLAGGTRNVILTGGEPALQIDEELLVVLSDNALSIGIETNGTMPLPRTDLIHWISCSPKTAEHSLKVGQVDELRYVRNRTQGIPMPSLTADHHYLSPEWVEGNAKETKQNIGHCVRLIREHPRWRLSVQQHKTWNLR